MSAGSGGLLHVLGGPSGTQDVEVTNVVDISLVNDYLPNVGNAPAAPGQCLAVPAASVATSVEVTVADLVPGRRYRMRLTPDVLTDTVHGIWKCSAAVAIANATDGTPILQHEEVIICLPAASTKVRVYFWLLADTPFDCHVWLSTASN